MARTRGGARLGRTNYPDVNNRTIPRRPNSDQTNFKENWTRLESALNREPEEFDLSWHENCPDISKIWIIQDQQSKTIADHQQASHDEKSQGSSLLLDSLHILPNDLKYEILDFVPTYSMRSDYKTKFESSQQEDMALVNEKCLYYLDKPFTTYHKMRVINKEYSRRMKTKILKTDTIDLSAFHEDIDVDRKKQLYYFLEFLRVQTLYERREISFEDPFIYEGVNNIKLFDSTIFPPQESFMLGAMPIGGKQDEKEPTLVVEIPQQLELTIDMNSEQLESILSEKIDSFGPTPRQRRRFANTGEERKDSRYAERANFYQNLSSNESLSIKKGKLVILRPRFTNEISEYVGENSYIKNITFSSMDGAFLTWILSSLTGLKTINFINIDSFPLLSRENGYHFENLEKVIFFNSRDMFLDGFSYLANCMPRSCTVETFLSGEVMDDDGLKMEYKYYVDNVLTHETTGAEAEKIMIYAHSNKSFILDEAMKNYLSCDFYHSGIIPFSFITSCEDIPISQRRILCDYIFKEKMVPIEYGINVYFNEKDLYIPYLIYLANTYQNGRIHFQTFEEVFNCLKFGWIPTKMVGELSLFLPPKYLPLTLCKIRNHLSEDEFIRYMRALLVSCILRGTEDIDLYSIYLNIMKNVPKEKKDILLRHLELTPTSDAKKKLAPSVTIPLIGLVFNNFQLGVTLLNDMSESDLLYQNELGDTILHLPLAHDNLLINMILEKQPKLAHILNNDNCTILHSFTSDNYYRIPVIHNLIHKFNADINHTDAFGKTPFDEGNFVLDEETGVISHKVY